MIDLTLSDLIKKSGVGIEDILLVRHSKNDKNCMMHYSEGVMKEYTAVQNKRFPQQYKYIMSFLSSGGTSAVLNAFYLIKGFSDSNEDLGSLYNEKYPQYGNKGDTIFIDLEELSTFAQYNNKLVIDWGKGTRSWYQKATNDKKILSLHPQKTKEFIGFEEIVLSYSELKEIIDDSILYAEWHSALKSVNAIYLITNTKNGKQYIGSAYGSNGLLGRWMCYGNTGHGYNKDMIKEIKASSDEFQNFQFSILQILSKNLSNGEIVDIETLYKKKLLTKTFGMNEN